MHWGNPDAANASDGKAVLTASNRYARVWHMDQPVKDEVGTLGLKAVYPDGVRTHEIPVKVQEAIPEPRVALSALVLPKNCIRGMYQRKGHTSNWGGEGENSHTEADDRSPIRLFHHCSPTGSAELAIQTDAYDHAAREYR